MTLKQKQAGQKKGKGNFTMSKKVAIRKVNEIASVGLEGKEDTILLLRELLYSFPDAKWKDAGEDAIIDSIRAIDSETDHILKGDDAKHLSPKELEEQKKDEKDALNFYKDDLIKLFEALSKVDY